MTASGARRDERTRERGDVSSTRARRKRTSFHADSLTSPPKLEEQGRDHCELAKRDGRWRIVRRTLTSDSGMPEGLLRSYVQR
jgi:hypothetical protein